MKSLLASLLTLLLITASIGAGVHAGGVGAWAMTDHHAMVADDGADALAECCDAAGHEISGSCFLTGVAPAGDSADRPPQAADALWPTSSPHFAATEPGALGKPPRTA